MTKFVYDERVRNKFLFIVCLSFIIFGFLIKPKPAFATVTFSQNPNPAYINSGSITFTFNSDKDEIKDTQSYTFAADRPGKTGYSTFFKTDKPKNGSFQVTMTDVRRGIQFGTPGTWKYKFGLGDYNQALGAGLLLEGNFFIYGCDKDSAGCPSLAVLQKTFEAHTQIPFFIVNAQKDQKYGVWFEHDQKIQVYETSNNPDLITNGFPSVKRFIDSGDPSPDLKRLCITQNIPLLGFSILGLSCDFSIPDIKIIPQHVDLVPENSAPILSNRPGVPNPSIPPEVYATNIPVPSPPCATLAPDGKCLNVNTAIGLISTDPQGFVKSIFSLVLGLAGGIALILIMVSGYKFMTSSGNPEAVKAATEQLTSAIIGLLFIIFSFVILQIIGVDILKIPGFSK